MIGFKQVSISLLLLSAVHAALQRSCIQSKVDALEGYGHGDATICYSGHNSILKNDKFTDKSKGMFGYLHHYKCNGADVHCFWIKAPNQWRGYAGMDYENMAMWSSLRCKFDKDSVTLTCE
ncbi:hypothetical protein NDA14_005419 [Ustilago hordei]|nr:hypothetical protein NDA14_005419 [Ustilago hordei]UTT93470.1 hypothetical protein NDA17_003748 [Ustilago hordei]